MIAVSTLEIVEDNYRDNYIEIIETIISSLQQKLSIPIRS